jgi:hypothetical protein
MGQEPKTGKTGHFAYVLTKYFKLSWQDALI